MGNNSQDRDRMVIANRQAWNDSAGRHKAGERWAQLLQDVSKPGFDCFDQTMTDALRRIDLRGKSVVQVGCNNGREVLSLSSFGLRRLWRHPRRAPDGARICLRRRYFEQEEGVRKSR